MICDLLITLVAGVVFILVLELIGQLFSVFGLLFDGVLHSLRLWLFGDDEVEDDGSAKPDK